MKAWTLASWTSHAANPAVILSIVFVLPCALAAAAMLVRSGRSANLLFVFAMLAPGMALTGAYLDAHAHQRGDRVVIELDRIELGLDRLVDLVPGRSADVFIVGDDPAIADLVVLPSSDPQRRLADRAAAPRVPMVITATRDGKADLAVTLHLRRIDPDAQFELPGMRAVVMEAPAPLSGKETVVSLRAGSLVRVRIERVDPDGGIQVRRAFTVSALPAEGETLVGPRIAIDLDSPLRAVAGTCRGVDGNPDLDLRLQPMGQSEVADNVMRADRLVFDQLGQGGRLPLLNNALLGPVSSPRAICSEPSLAFAWPASEAGGESAGNRLFLQSRLVSLPNFLPIFVVLLGAALALGAFQCGLGPSLRVGLPFVVLMLGYRLLIAIAGPYYDAGLSSADTLGDAGLAFAGVPALLIVLFAPRHATRGGLTSLFLIVLGASGGFLVWLDHWPSSRTLWPVTAACSVILWRLLATETDRSRARRAFLGMRARWATNPRAWAIGILASACLVRLVLAAPPLYARERLFGVPLSTPFYVACLVAFAILAEGFVTGKVRSLRDSLLVGAVGGAALLLTPLLVHDAGFAFVAAPPCLALLARAAIRSHAEPIARAIPVLALLAFPLAVIGYAAVLTHGVQFLAELSPLDRIEAMLAYDGNAVRLIQFIDPSVLAEFATLDAYAAIEQQYLLAALTQGHLGPGWLAPADLHSLRPVQLSDNAVAVHLMWPFGRLSILAPLAAVAIFGWTCMRRAGSDAGGNAAWLAAAIIIWTSLYIVLCNLLLLPFIGRNVYFLAPTSGGDLLEATMLVALAVTALRPARSA